MNSTNKTFNYEKKKWGAAPITNFYTDFQGLELQYLISDVIYPFFNISKKSSNQFALLDLGCGGGNIAAFFKFRYPYWHTVGIDISRESIKTAKKQFPQVEFIYAPAHKIPKQEGLFDIITSFDTLEHFDELEEVLEESYRLLKMNGIFCIGVPLEREFPTLYWILYQLGWRGKKHYSGHVNFFTDKSLEKLMRKHGFILQKKRFSFHLLFSIFDIGYYFLQAMIGKPVAFESTVAEMSSSPKKSFLMNLKKSISIIGYIESRIFWWFPGGKGHFIFIKKPKADFFSSNPPLTVIESYQQKYGLNKVVQPRDLEIKKRLDQMHFAKSKSVLDFGCANGIWLERLLAHTSAKGMGIDVADRLVRYANSRVNKKGEYYNSFKSWPIKDNSIDFCYSFDTFEHIVDRDAEIKRLYASMKKGGKFFFYTINPNNKYTIDWFFEKMGSNYMYDRADHKKELFISPEDLEKLLKLAGFKNIQFALYDGPANLLWRVISFAYLSVMEKITNIVQIRFLLPVIISLNDTVLRIVTPLNDMVDKLFIKRGYSNGYFMWGEK